MRKVGTPCPAYEYEYRTAWGRDEERVMVIPCDSGHHVVLLTLADGRFRLACECEAGRGARALLDDIAGVGSASPFYCVVGWVEPGFAKGLDSGEPEVCEAICQVLDAWFTATEWAPGPEVQSFAAWCAKIREEYPQFGRHHGTIGAP